MPRFRMSQLVPPSSEASVSYSSFQQITGLTRDFIARGIRILVGRGLIEVVDHDKQHAYRLLEHPEYNGIRALLPGEYLRRGRLAFLGHEYRFDLDALKIYLTIAALQDEEREPAALSHKALIEYTGVHPLHIPFALASLTDAGLIKLDPEDNELSELNAKRRYFIVNDVDSSNTTGRVDYVQLGGDE